MKVLEQKPQHSIKRIRTTLTDNRRNRGRKWRQFPHVWIQRAARINPKREQSTGFQNLSARSAWIYRHPVIHERYATCIDGTSILESTDSRLRSWIVSLRSESSEGRNPRWSSTEKAKTWCDWCHQWRCTWSAVSCRSNAIRLHP